MTPPITPAPKPDFATSFRFPEITRTAETGIAGLSIIFVYEKNIPADPIIPQPWYRTADGRTFGITYPQDALAHLGWTPRSEADALLAARLPHLSYDSRHRVVTSAPDEIPRDQPLARAVEPPRAVERDGVWEVVQFTFTPQYREWFDRTDRPAELLREVVIVGPGVFRLGCQVVWTARVQAPPPPSPPPSKP